MEIIKEAVKKESQAIKKEAKEKTLGYILAAFGLVAGLAWNDAIKGLIEYWFPLQGNSLFIKFVYAILLTLALVFVTVYLSRLLKKNDEQT